MPMHPWLRSQARTSVVSPSWNCSPKQYLDVLRDRQTPGTLTWNMGTRIEARRMPACLLRGAHDRACRHLGENDGSVCVSCASNNLFHENGWTMGDAICVVISTRIVWMMRIALCTDAPPDGYTRVFVY